MEIFVLPLRFYKLPDIWPDSSFVQTFSKLPIASSAGRALSFDVWEDAAMGRWGEYLSKISPFLSPFVVARNFLIMVVVSIKAFFAVC